MGFEFGYIKQYDKRGFGFVSQELTPLQKSEDVFFHISTIKEKYPEFGRSLDWGKWKGKYFFYLTESSNRGEAVCEVWLTAADLPEDLRYQLLQRLESHWKNVTSRLPNWVEKVTLELVGKEELAKWRELRNQITLEQKLAEQKRFEEEKRKKEEEEKRKEEEVRKKEEEAQEKAEREALKTGQELPQLFEDQEPHQLHDKIIWIDSVTSDIISTETNVDQEVDSRTLIKAFCAQRGIQALMHFTRVENLPSILKHGLLSRRELEVKGLEYVYNDDLRLDGRNEGISISISFPNYRMFYRYRMALPQQQWSVILLSPSLLWEKDCAFCKSNAASNSVRCVPIDELKGVQALQALFEDLPNKSRKELNIPDHSPTDPQAEVLIFEPIPVETILEIHFEIEPSAELVTELRRINPTLKFEIDRRYFAPRSDYPHWTQYPYIPF